MGGHGAEHDPRWVGMGQNMILGGGHGAEHDPRWVGTGQNMILCGWATQLLIFICNGCCVILVHADMNYFIFVSLYACFCVLCIWVGVYAHVCGCKRVYIYACVNVCV